MQVCLCVCALLMHSPIYPGAYLLRCAEVEQKLGQCQQRFQEKAIAEFITPLKAFLEIDVKAVMVRELSSNQSE